MIERFIYLVMRSGIPIKAYLDRKHAESEAWALETYVNKGVRKNKRINYEIKEVELRGWGQEEDFADVKELMAKVSGIGVKS